MLNITELEINGFCKFEPDEERYLPLACSNIREHARNGIKKFNRLLSSDQDEVAYDLFCDLLNSDESMAFDVLMNPNVKKMFLDIRESNFSTTKISEVILVSFKETIDDLFLYYYEEFQNDLNNQKYRD